MWQVTGEFALLTPSYWPSGYFKTYEAARTLAEKWKEIHEEGVWNIKVVYLPNRI